MMIKLERILFATDFSEYADSARRYACFLTDRFQAELHLLHVLHDLSKEIPEFAMGFALTGLTENLQKRHERLEEEAMAALERELDPNWRAKHRVLLATRTGSPFVEIIRYARKYDVDLIVLGTHGRTGLSHALIGSVAEKVVRKADCPVLTIRPTPVAEEEVSREVASGIAPAPA